jgi:RimJ/RimL family protein N-acetyltransferase
MNLNQVTLQSLDVARAAAFYRALGFIQVVDSAPRYARFECPDGGATFSLHQVEAMPQGECALVYFECRDLDARHASLAAQGIAFDTPPTDERWLWREARLRDPDGNRLCFYLAGRNRRFPPWRVRPAQARRVMPGGVRVVPIEPEHVEAFHAALDRVARERRYLALTAAPPLEDTRRFVLENIACGDPQFVALEGEALLGWCDVQRGRRETSSHVGVLGMALVAEHRGRGIGEGLLRATLEAAWARGMTRIELAVREGNVPAIRLYERLGFDHEGVRRGAHRDGDRSEDVLAMALLREAGA